MSTLLSTPNGSSLGAAQVTIPPRWIYIGLVGRFEDVEVVNTFLIQTFLRFSSVEGNGAKLKRWRQKKVRATSPSIHRPIQR